MCFDIISLVSIGTTTDDLWTPYKELVSVVEGYLAHESGGAPYAVHTFESVLRRHKQTFLSLFKNPVSIPVQAMNYSVFISVFGLLCM